jgi:siroheme synthase (precorrin-2 oxidase/ferrochelatase)
VSPELPEGLGFTLARAVAWLVFISLPPPGLVSMWNIYGIYDFWRFIILACADSRIESRIKELASNISIPIKDLPKNKITFYRGLIV